MSGTAPAFVESATDGPVWTAGTLGPTDYPPDLQRLLTADQASVEAAWEAFVANRSRLLMHVARARGGDHDQILDRYVYVLEHLREGSFTRLRSYRADGRSRFSTWLVVVARRLGLDQHRERYGRKSSVDPWKGEGQSARKRIVDLIAEPVDPEALRSEGDGPEEERRKKELGWALSSVVEGLDARSQLLLRLRFEDALSAAEIARVLKLPTQFHVYRQLNQLLSLLRRELQKVGVQDALP
jgi:RNA polymerase sigma factor (sigma-70 family)